MIAFEYLTNIVVVSSLTAVALVIAPVFDCCIRKTKQLNELRLVVKQTSSRQNNSFLTSVVDTCSLLKKTVAVYCNNFLFGTFSCSKNVYLVEYFHNMNWYYIPIHTKRGPKPYIKEAYTMEHPHKKCYTDFIKKVAGPNVDFYNLHITPHQLGIHHDLIILVDGHERHFKPSDFIKIK